MELTKQFSDDQYAAALESWSWLDLHGKTPRFASLFGNIFLEDEHGAWWFLDTLGGELTPGWASRAELIADLETEEGQDQYLLGALAMAAFHRRGLSLNDDEVYAYAPPPIVTGSFNVDEIQVFRFSVVVNIAGQLHQQLQHPSAD
ncbi:hypothetical protein ACFQFC_17325 [Amorphoplanes digitatis]|uniref:T6SS immunity protein Tdi1 C-terminal domain-containing protein n=1 Tax=Actinoplanes digitatis TaxID=1868 RepID=A0A7W7I3X3_9ACTN|nr:hypothetical protein [Actinoplanes digitatis]MBB4765975.1 hypothetical protein [Actinoplanes digitatis]BFE75940.1 hypothetical protein GCM10020092_092410 [Actinoplanes digitatis]GID97267.1 hypothetical protein Adi01nite_66790 [Actinoplanes digitatis]